MQVANARMSAASWAREMVDDPSTVFIDTETTGLDGSAEIVDIAVVGVDGSVLFDTLVKPTRPIPSFVSRIHGIYDHHVAGAPCWADIYDVLVPLLWDRPVVVYNVDYDRRLIRQCCSQWTLPAIDASARWHCAMKGYSAYVAGDGRGRRHKLENAARSFGIQPGGHRAFGDAEATRQLVWRMATG